MLGGQSVTVSFSPPPATLVVQMPASIAQRYAVLFHRAPPVFCTLQSRLEALQGNIQTRLPAIEVES
jgi:hypothetical protein